MNSVDAAKRGIANGDVVKVSSLRGAILAGAVVTDGVRAGTIVVRHGGWFDPQEEKWRGELLEVRAFNAPHLGK